MESVDRQDRGSLYQSTAHKQVFKQSFPDDFIVSGRFGEGGKHSGLSIQTVEGMEAGTDLIRSVWPDRRVVLPALDHRSGRTATVEITLT